MTVTYASSLSSLKAQTNLKNTSDQLGKTFERLSSGLRINKASDDPAGVALADSLKSDSNLYTQAVRNINDGISAINVFESTVQELTNIVIRQKELAESAANETSTFSIRQALNDEANALVAEYNRIIASVKYNDRELGTAVGLQIGIQAGISGGSSANTINTIFSSQLGRAEGTGSYNYSALVAGNGPTMAVGDFNNDGKQDYATTLQVTTASGWVNVFFGNGDGTFASAYSSSLGGVPSGSDNHYITAGDFNNDGVDDFYVETGSNSGYIRVFLNNGSGSFTATGTYVAASLNSTIGPMLGDYNGDGNLDVMATSGGSRMLLFGDGAGTLTPQTTVSTTTLTGRGTSGDFNNDGYDDVAIVGGGAGTGGYAILLGSASGTFTQGASIATISSPNRVIDGDYNHDGYTDLVVLSTSVIQFYEGNGSGTFTAGGTFALTSSSQAATFAVDVNGDGHLDIASRGAATTMTYSLGNGDGTFQTAQTYSVATTATEQEYADFNGDFVNDFIIHDTGNTLLGMAVTTAKTTQAYMDLMSKESALFELDRLDAALTRVTLEAGVIGASRSRLEVAVSNAQSAADLSKLAESRIRDADIAEEVAKMVRLQVLQKAGAAILAQANLQPEQALKLLSSID